ncbi:MAG: transposase [Chthoniobacteraceae bacterium]|nr:transposase [Chthoniobacteraceae bacterium]
MTGMPKKYHVKLEADEGTRLEAILRKGKASAHAQRHARILLLSDSSNPQKGWNDARIAEAVGTCVPTVERLRKLFVEEVIDRAMAAQKPARHFIPKLDGSAEARLVAMACGPAPQGQARWTLRLLADKLVELEVVESISYESVRRTLKKMRSNPGRKSSGSSPKPAAPSS